MQDLMRIMMRMRMRMMRMMMVMMMMMAPGSKFTLPPRTSITCKAFHIVGGRL
jgi:hypothetical protein